MGNNEASSRQIDLSFLDEGQTYIAYVYADGGEETGTRTQVKCSEWLVDGKQALRFALKPRGGAAVRLVPVSDQDDRKVESYQGQLL